MLYNHITSYLTYSSICLWLYGSCQNSFRSSHYLFMAIYDGDGNDNGDDSNAIVMRSIWQKNIVNSP